MATELAQAYVQIIPSAQGIKGRLAEAMGGDAEASSAGQSMGLALVNKIKGVIAAAGIAAAFKQAISEGAAIEQSIGGIETLFKESSDAVIKNAQNAYRTAGLSANDYMESVTSFSASLLQGLGGDTAEAARIADMAMVDMSDNANKMGTDMSSIQNAYQGFAKQNYTMLDNLKLGYGGTKSEMERLLKDAEKLSGVKYDINNLNDVYEAIHVVQEELGITGTTAEEASSTISGSLAAVKASFDNVLGYLATGMDVGPAIRQLVETGCTFLFNNLVPMVGNIIMALPGALATFVETAVPMLIENIRGLAEGGLMETVSNIFDEVIAFLSDGLPTLLDQGVQMVTNIANGLLQNAPAAITSIGNILTRLINAIAKAMPTILQKGFELVKNLVSGIIQNLPSIVSAAARVVAQMASAIGNNLPFILQKGVELLMQLLTGILNAIPQIPGYIAQVVSGIRSAFSGVDWGGIGRNIISGIANGIAGGAGSIISAARNAARSALNAAKSLLGIHSPSRVFRDVVGKNIALGWAEGIEANSDLVEDSMSDLSDAAINAAGIGDINASLNSSVNTTSTGTARIIELLENLAEIVPEVKRQKNVVLDSGALVGEIAPAMDKALGVVASKKVRGYA